MPLFRYRALANRCSSPFQPISTFLTSILQCKSLSPPTGETTPFNSSVLPLRKRNRLFHFSPQSAALDRNWPSALCQPYPFQPYVRRLNLEISKIWVPSWCWEKISKPNRLGIKRQNPSHHDFRFPKTPNVSDRTCQFSTRRGLLRTHQPGIPRPRSQKAMDLARAKMNETYELEDLIRTTLKELAKG